MKYIVNKDFISTSKHKLNIGDIINIKLSASNTAICVVNDKTIVLTKEEIKTNANAFL